MFSYYAADWKYELIKENYFDCNSGGVKAVSAVSEQALPSRLTTRS